MKKTYLLLAISLLLSSIVCGQSIVKPSINTKTTFAIIIDSKSYAEAKKEVDEYKKIIENDGLGTYIISHTWTKPDEIREILIKLYNDKKAPLEGTVLVGDIPIPMLRDAQHLTSAFKMDQKRNWQQSSVPSDRFYDDFGLKFDYLKQDSIKSLYFYYSLRPDSEQVLSSNIYSARIKPLENGKTDKYSQLRAYLQKVVDIRSSEKSNIIDNLTVARGHGYNSESRVAWSGEQLALKEQFPNLFAANNFVKFMEFDSYWPMKAYWLNEVQRPDLDVMLFHHHGSNDYQYINGYKEGSDVNTSKENIKLYLRSKISGAVKKGKDKEETIEYYMKSLDVPRSWCKEAFDPAILAQDSILNDSLDILVRDIYTITPNARFVMFDACYNGSFYEDEYIAGAYLFNSGKTIVTQGNTVNTIQDKWPDEFLGLLNSGIRIGLWGKYVHFLETHIIGDPTYHFTKNLNSNININEALTIHKNDIAYWKEALSEADADIKTIALRVLFDNDYKNISDLLKQTYFQSQDMVIRLEALQLLSRMDNDDFIEVLAAAMSDSYELTRRYAAEYIVKNGSEKLISSLAKAILNDNTSKRINFKISSGLRMVNLEKLKAELELQAAGRPFYSSDMLDKTLKEIESVQKSKDSSLSLITNTEEKAKNRIFDITRFRNQPASDGIDTLLSIAADTANEKAIRSVTIEALGWFNYSYRKGYLIEKLNEILSIEKDSDLINETTKSINRLKSK